MNGNPWFDDISRVVGSGMPRRQAIRMILGGLAGVAFSELGFPRLARACVNCPNSKLPDGHCCDTVAQCTPFICCPTGTVSCLKSNTPNGHCCATQARCRPDGCCPEGQVGCPGSTLTGGHCCDSLAQCRPSLCCEKGKVNCPNSTLTDGHCCPTVAQCRPSTCCDCQAKFQPSKLRSAAPRMQMDMIVQDAVYGIASLSSTRLVNATIEIPAFEAGTTDPIVCTVTKLDPSRSAQFELEACNPGPDKCCKNGDPVLTVLRIAEGEGRFQETFAGLPASERYVRVQNGYPGLPRVDIHVNGRQAGSLRLGREEVAMLDVGRFMARGSGNILTLVGFGRPGHSALVVVSDDPGTSGKASAGLPLVEWDSGSFPPGQNLRWGR